MTSQIAFVGPEGMTVSWDVSAPGAFDSEPLTCPARYNFPQGDIYRLKLTKIPGRPGVELYPTLEVGPVMPRTEAFLAHNAIPVQFTPGRLRPGAHRQLRDQGDLPARSGVPGIGVGRRGDAGQHAARSGRRSDRRSRSSRCDPCASCGLGNKDLQVPGGHVQEGGVAAARINRRTVARRCPVPMPMGMPVERRRPCRWAASPA